MTIELSAPSSANRPPHLFGEAYKRARMLVRLLQKDDAINALLSSCNTIGEAFLFGGAVRDAMFGAQSFGDLDIFVSGPIDEELLQKLARSSRRTNFGGMRLVVGRFDVDIWELPKSHAFRVGPGRAVSINGLLASVCFSTDAVAISLLNGKLVCDQRFRSSLANNALSFIQKPQSLEILQTVRIARLVVKLDVVPDASVRSYFLAGIDFFGVEALLSAESKWKGRRVLDAPLVESFSAWCRSEECDNISLVVRKLV